MTVLAESQEILEDSERTLSSVTDEDTQDTRTLSGGRYYHDKKKNYSKYYGYGDYKKGKYYKGRKLEGQSKGVCNCFPTKTISKYHKNYKSFISPDPDVCCQTCRDWGFNFSSYDVPKNLCYCYKYVDYYPSKWTKYNNYFFCKVVY